MVDFHGRTVSFREGTLISPKALAFHPHLQGLEASGMSWNQASTTEADVSRLGDVGATPKMVGFPNKPMGFPTKNDHFGVFWGYHHLRKHPCMFSRKKSDKMASLLSS